MNTSWLPCIFCVHLAHQLSTSSKKIHYIYIRCNILLNTRGITVLDISETSQSVHAVTAVKTVCCVLCWLCWSMATAWHNKSPNVIEDVWKIQLVFVVSSPTPVPMTLMLWSNIASPITLVLFFFWLWLQQKWKNNFLCLASCIQFSFWLWVCSLPPRGDHQHYVYYSHCT